MCFRQAVAGVSEVFLLLSLANEWRYNRALKTNKKIGLLIEILESHFDSQSFPGYGVPANSLGVSKA